MSFGIRTRDARGASWPNSTESCDEVATLLYTLGVAKPNCIYMYDVLNSSEIRRLLKYSLGTVQQPATVVDALRIAMKLHQLVEFTLANDEGVKLLEYFSMHISKWKDTSHARMTIEMLPFFITVWNKQTNLKNATAYVLPLEIPQWGMDRLIVSEDVRLLQHISCLKPLLEYLNCKCLTIEESYCSFILKHFQNLSREAQLVHLKFLKQHVLRNVYLENQERNEDLVKLLACLKDTALIPNRSDVLGRVSEFYDPQNEIFQVMHEDDRFPSDPFNNEDWLRFLRMCGLVHKITKEKFLSYAQQVERNSQSVPFNSEVLKKSKTLVRHFLSRNDYKDRDLKFVSNIRFVSPGIVAETLESLHIQFGARDDHQRLRFICFSGASQHCNAELVWTVQSLLPQWLASYTTDLFSGLDVISDQVPSRTVAEHVNKLCSSLKKDSLASSPEKVKTLTKVLQKALQYFKDRVDLELDVKGILSRTCCVFVADSFDLVAPNQLAIDITSKDEIRPYLFKIPLDFGSYTPVLMQLGTTKVLTAKQYVCALRKIADGSQGKEMHPEEQNASCRASKGLLQLIEKGENVDGDIFLPCTDNKLHRSSEVIFNNKRLLLQRLSNLDYPILIDSKDLNIKSDLETIFKKMPVSQRPRFLSQIVREVLADGESIKSEFAEKVAARLRDLVFRSGLERIVRHCCAKNISEMAKWNEETHKQICKQLMNGLDNMEFVCRNQVQTYLKCDARKIDNSEKELKYFYEKASHGDSAKGKFYISADAYRLSDVLYRAIARVLNDHVGKRVIDESLLVHILECPVDEIHEVLDSNDIMESESSRPFVPPLGCYIPEEHLHLLIHDNFIFYPGQLVALEIDDPFDRGESGNPTFILVEIVERQEPDDGSVIASLLTKYKILVSLDEERIVDAMSLYAFSRYNMETSYDQTMARHVKREGATSSQKPTPVEPPKAPKTLQQVVDEIKKMLKDAWKGTPEERNKVRKRLYLIWHPDKNPDRIEFCTEVCKILQHLVERLEKGQSIDDYSTSDKSSSSSRTASGSGSGFDDFYYRAGRRSNYFNRRRGRSSSNFFGRHSGGFYSSRQESENFFSGFRTNRNPQPQEGRRWMRQAWHNLGSVKNDLNAFDWRCLKCFEAVQIALMAVQYATDSNSVPSDVDRIDSLLRDIPDAELRRLSQQLEHLVTGAPLMKYPRGHKYPLIPGEVYNESQGNLAYRLSKQILDRCDQLIDRSQPSHAE